GRPADVVKELVENAVDAIFVARGVTARLEREFPVGRVQVEVRGGGAQLIKVTDDGCGIAAAELPLAFARHATSKIDSAEDLNGVGTLGFRGEALPSVAAVSQINVITRAADESAGAFLALAAGEATSQGPRSWASGTSIAVRNLFYNVPARRRFMRSPGSESGYIAHLICQFALSYPEIQFTLELEGRVTFRAPGSGRLDDAVAAVYGAEALRQMAPVVPGGVTEAAGGPAMYVDGFVSQPSLTHANRTHISLFVNRRWVQNRALVFAVEEAYHDLLPPGRHPVAVLNLTVRPGDVDVNVHPTKAEVRFTRERQAFADVQRAVRAALAASVPVRELVARPSATSPGFPAEPSQAELTFAPSGPAPDLQGTRPYEPPPVVTAGGRRLPVLRVIGQVGGAFIVAEGPSGLYLIDQHRAHERVLYDRFVRARQAGEDSVQLLLDPLSLELTPSQAARIAPKLGELADLGLRMEPFGERTYLVRAVPASLKGGDLQASLLEIVELLLDEQDKADWHERAVATLACHHAIRAGQILNVEEMRQLIEQLESSPLPQTCPHGAPTMMHFSQAQLEKEFLRR
ncbi:MAG: DNA mismatch repair endonuclease MutL, partial [Chloroflexota bacterium]